MVWLPVTRMTSDITGVNTKVTFWNVICFDILEMYYPSPRINWAGRTTTRWNGVDMRPSFPHRRSRLSASWTKIPSRLSRGWRTIKVGQSWRTCERRRLARPTRSREHPVQKISPPRRHHPPSVTLRRLAESRSHPPCGSPGDNNSSIMFLFSPPHLPSRYRLRRPQQPSASRSTSVWRHGHNVSTSPSQNRFGCQVNSGRRTTGPDETVRAGSRHRRAEQKKWLRYGAGEWAIIEVPAGLRPAPATAGGSGWPTRMVQKRAVSGCSTGTKEKGVRFPGSLAHS